MPFKNDTNNGRITKILEILDLISKSAESNKASNQELLKMIAPVGIRLESLTGAVFSVPGSGSTSSSEAPQEPSRPSRPLNQPMWADIRQMAQEAPLDELSAALAVYMNRVDELLHNQNKTSRKGTSS